MKFVPWELGNGWFHCPAENLLRDTVEPAFRILNSVHSLPAITSTHLRYNEVYKDCVSRNETVALVKIDELSSLQNRGDDEFGRFTHGRSVVGPAAYRLTKNGPQSLIHVYPFKVTPLTGADHFLTTFLHEVGHMMDFEVKGYGAIFGSAHLETWVMLRQALQSSSWFAELNTVAAKAAVRRDVLISWDMERSRQTYSPDSSLEERELDRIGFQCERLISLATPVEVFARLYSQWIVATSPLLSHQERADQLVVFAWEQEIVDSVIPSLGLESTIRPPQLYAPTSFLNHVANEVFAPLVAHCPPIH